MEIENGYKAIAGAEFLLNAPVVIEEGRCRAATRQDLAEEEIYHIVNDKVKKGEEALLAGKDTIIHI